MKTRRKKQTKRVLASALAALVDSICSSGFQFSRSCRRISGQERIKAEILQAQHRIVMMDGKNGLFQSETVESGQVYLVVCRQSVFS